MNKFKVSLSDLNASINLGKALLSDKTAVDDNKQMVFLATADKVIFGVHNPFGFTRRDLGAYDIEVGTGGWNIKLNPNELTKLLSAYNSLPDTVVDYLLFEEAGSKVRILVHEEPKKSNAAPAAQDDMSDDDFDGFPDEDDEDDDSLGEAYIQDISYTLSSSAIPTPVLDAMHIAFPKEIEQRESLPMKLCLEALRPLISNDSTQGTSSSIYSVPDYLYVTTNNLFSFFRNFLPESMHNISLTYTSVVSISKLLDLATTGRVSDGDSPEEGTAEVEVWDDLNKFIETGLVKSETDKLQYLAFRAGRTELFVRPKSSKMVAFQQYIGSIFEKDADGAFTNRSMEISVKRTYFKSVLKRPSVDGGDVTVTFEDGFMVLSTQNFSQHVPADFDYDVLKDVKFAISLAMFEKMILDASIYTNDYLSIYLVKRDRKAYSLFMMDHLPGMEDQDGLWGSVVNVTSR